MTKPESTTQLQEKNARKINKNDEYTFHTL